MDGDASRAQLSFSVISLAGVVIGGFWKKPTRLGLIGVLDLLGFSGFEFACFVFVLFSLLLMFSWGVERMFLLVLTELPEWFVPGNSCFR